MESKQNRYILIGLTVFCILLIGVTAINDQWLAPLRTGVGYVLIPIQSGVNRVGISIYQELSDYGQLKTALEENRRLTIAPYLTEPFSFADSDARIQEAVEQYLSESARVFQIVCDVTSATPEDRSQMVLDQVKNTMTARGEYGQISVETQYGIADYAIISVTITD